MIKKIVFLVLITFSAFSVSATALAENTENFEDIDMVADQVCTWLNAWQKKDFDAYISFYSLEFKSFKLDYQSFKEKKTRIFKQLGQFSVDITGLCVRIENETAVVSFIQNYKSSSLSDIGQKLMSWKNENGVWKIINEKWKLLPGFTEFITGETDISAAEGLIVHDITAAVEDKEKGIEKIIVKLNQYAVPEISSVEGDSPTIIMDFKDVSFWQGPNEIFSNSKMVKYIRAYLCDNCQSLKIILYLEPLISYHATPIFYKAQTTFCLEIAKDETQ